MLIACISLEDQFIEDSLRTIEFAKNVKNIKVQEVKRNDSITIASNNEGLKEENASKDIEILSLKKRIQDLEGIISKQSESYTMVQEFHLQKGVEKGSMLLKLLETNRRLNSYLKESSIILLPKSCKDLKTSNSQGSIMSYHSQQLNSQVSCGRYLQLN